MAKYAVVLRRKVTAYQTRMEPIFVEADSVEEAEQKAQDQDDGMADPNWISLEFDEVENEWLEHEVEVEA